MTSAVLAESISSMLRPTEQTTEQLGVTKTDDSARFSVNGTREVVNLDFTLAFLEPIHCMP